VSKNQITLPIAIFGQLLSSDPETYLRFRLKDLRNIPGPYEYRQHRLELAQAAYDVWSEFSPHHAEEMFEYRRLQKCDQEELNLKLRQFTNAAERVLEELVELGGLELVDSGKPFNLGPSQLRLREKQADRRRFKIVVEAASKEVSVDSMLRLSEAIHKAEEHEPLIQRPLSVQRSDVGAIRMWFASQLNASIELRRG
jgi:hypothetical protein